MGAGMKGRVERARADRIALLATVGESPVYRYCTSCFEEIPVGIRKLEDRAVVVLVAAAICIGVVVVVAVTAAVAVAVVVVSAGRAHSVIAVESANLTPGEAEVAYGRARQF